MRHKCYLIYSQVNREPFQLIRVKIFSLGNLWFRWCASHPMLNSRKTTMSQYCPGVLYRMLLNFCPCTKVRGVQNELARGFGDPLEAFIQKFRAQQLGSRYFTKSNKCGSSGQRRVAWNFQRPHLGTQLSMPLLLQAFARGTALRCLCLFTWSHYLKSICSTRSWCILSKLWLGIIFSNFQPFALEILLNEK